MLAITLGFATYSSLNKRKPPMPSGPISCTTLYEATESPSNIRLTVASMMQGTAWSLRVCQMLHTFLQHPPGCRAVTISSPLSLMLERAL